MPLVFQYGSNCDAAEFNSQERLDGRAVDLGAARTVEIFEFAFDKQSVKRGCAAADLIEGETERAIWGVLYEISDNDLKKLGDKIEGPSYQPASIYVENRSGEIVLATTFVVKAARRQKNLFTNAQYVGHIVSGLRSHGVPEEYVQHIIYTALNTKN